MQFAAATLLTAGAAILLTAALPAQFKSTSTLVLAPTTVTDSKGQYVDGLEAQDLVLYDNNVVQPIQVDEAIYPISLVVAVETSANSQAVIDKLGGSGILFTELLAASGGETAILTFAGDVRVPQEFTTSPDQLEKSLRSLHVQTGSAASLDAVAEALKLLEQRRPERRRVILLIAEQHDRASKRKFTDVLRQVQGQNVLIYWLTYSPSLSAFTTKPKAGNGGAVPNETGPQNLLNIIPELVTLGKPAAAQELAKATGGRSVGFLKQDALEEAIQSVAAEIHRQYMVSFQPRPSPPGKFHAIRVAVKDRPELAARTRAGYWPLP